MKEENLNYPVDMSPDSFILNPVMDELRKIIPAIRGQEWRMKL